MSNFPKRTIWKTTLRFVDGPQEIALPLGADVLSVHEQHGSVVMWFICTPAAPKQTRKFQIVGTGHAAPEYALYEGTAFMPNGLVWHVFELAPLDVSELPGAQTSGT